MADLSLDELLALNQAPDAPQQPAAGPTPTPVAAQPSATPPSEPSLEQLLAMNEAPDAPVLEQPTQSPQAVAEQPQAEPEVRMRAPDGSLVFVPASYASTAERQGYSTYTAEQEALEAREREYGTFGNQVLTGLEGFARGATLGLSDVASNALAGGLTSTLDEAPRAAERGLAANVTDESAFGRGYRQNREGQTAREEVNRGTALAGEALGIVGTALATGGSSLMAKAAAYTPAGATALLGARVQAAIAQKFGQSAVAKIGALAAAGAAEGGIQAAAQSVVDDIASGDFEISAERMASAALDALKSAGMGMLLGGGVGGVLGTLGQAASKGAQAMSDLPSIRQMAGDSAYKAAVGRTSKAAIKAAERHGGAASVGETLLQEGMPLTASADELYGALNARADEVGKQLGAMVNEATTLGGKGPSRKGLKEAIEEQVMRPLDESPINRDLARKMRSEFRDLFDDLSKGDQNIVRRSRDGAEVALNRDAIGFDELNTLRKQLDQRIKWDKFAPDAALEARKRLRNVIEDYWITSADQAAEAAGRAGFVDDLMALKKRYAHLALARDQAEERVITELANRSTSLTDTIVGAATGAGAGDPVTGFLASQVHKFVRERGRGVVAKAAYALSNAAEAAVKQQAALTNAAKQTANAARGVAIAKSAPLAISMSAPAIQRAITESFAMQDPASPQRMALQKQLEQLSAESPELASAIERQVVGVSEFIANKVGPRADGADPFAVKSVPMDPVKSRKVARYIEAARRPGMALERIASGIGTQEDLETLQTLYPRMYQRYVDEVLVRLSRLKQPPSRAARQKLFYATGIPMAANMQPDRLAFLQSVDPGEVSRQDEGAGALQPIKGADSGSKTEFRVDQKLSRVDAMLGGRDD